MTETEREVRLLSVVRDRHPEFEITPVFGGYDAVERPGVILRHSSLEGLEEKITAYERDCAAEAGRLTS